MKPIITKHLAAMLLMLVLPCGSARAETPPDSPIVQAAPGAAPEAAPAAPPAPPIPPTTSAPPPAASVGPAAPSAQITPLRHQGEIARKLLGARRFIQLQDQANLALRNNYKLADGTPTLRALYAGLSLDPSTLGSAPATQANWDALYRLLAEWRAKTPDAVMPELLEVTASINQAWQVRGSAFYKDVPEERRRQFHAMMEQVERRLVAMRPEVRAHPEWTVAMLRTGIANDWDGKLYFRVFVESTRRHPYYESPYLIAAVYLMPKWAGSPELINLFAQHMRDLMGPGDGEILYTRINAAAASDTMFTDGQADWPRMRSGFERLVTLFPHPLNFNTYAALACRAGDAPAFLRASQNIGEPMIAVWGTGIKRYIDCAGQAREGTMQPAWK
jgi:hypothetical protein